MMEGLRHYAGDGYRVTLTDQTGLRKMLREQPERLKSMHGILHCSWIDCPIEVLRKAAPTAVLTTLLASHGFEFPFPPEDPNDLAAGIATPLRNLHRAKVVLPKFDGLLCVSDRIWRAARMLFDENKVVRVVPGVDLEVFKPAPLPNGDKLVVGWCGQVPAKDRNNTKGYREVLQPLMERMADKVAWQINGRSAADALSQSEMVAWYRGIDVMLSTSSSEGCQMPLLEAAAMGRPVIATDVGAADELLQKGSNGGIVPGYRTVAQSPAIIDCFEQWVTDANEKRKWTSLAGQFSSKRAEEHFSWARRASEWLELIGG